MRCNFPLDFPLFMAGDGSIFSFYTIANTLNWDRKPAFKIYTDVMRVYSPRKILPTLTWFLVSSSQKSSITLSPLTSASLAPGSKVYKGLQTHCCSSSIPRANSRISWHWTLQRGRAWKHTHNASFSLNNKPST